MDRIEPKLVTIFGGSGFVGTQIVQFLAKRGHRIRVAVRRPDLAGHVKMFGSVGQVQPIQANVRNAASVRRAVAGVDIVINLAGVGYSRGAQTFDAVHVTGARNVAEAAQLMGHPYSLRGPVIRGDGRGKKIGVPTANIDYPREKIVPAKGIYAGWATLDGEKHRVAVSIGVNPTFTPDKQTLSVEAYLLEFDRDIYGKELKIEFIARLRDELRFSSVDALVEQIWKDVEQARQILEA